MVYDASDRTAWAVDPCAVSIVSIRILEDSETTSQCAGQRKLFIWTQMMVSTQGKGQSFYYYGIIFFPKRKKERERKKNKGLAQVDHFW